MDQLELPKYLLIDNSNLSKIIHGQTQPDSKGKKFTVVGTLTQETTSNVFEISLLGTNGLVVQVQIKGPKPEISFFHSEIFQISDLKLRISEVSTTLISTKRTQITKINPISANTSSVVKNNKNPDAKDQLWRVLVMPLKKYAISTETGVKFEHKTLLEISEKVIFKGILLSSERSNSHSGIGQTLIFRDTLTNDQLSVYVIYPKSESSQFFINSLSKFSTFEVKASRMISKNLEIYSRLFLSPDHSELSLVKTHVFPCNDLECPCKITKGRFSPLFASFSFIHEIKSFVLFRCNLKLFLRAMFLNFVLCKEVCANCQERLKSGRKCCGVPSPVFTLNASFIAEDSTGIAECFVTKLDDLQALFGFNDESLQDFQAILACKSERVVRYIDFTERVKSNLKNLSPRLKYCIGKVKVKPKDTPLVSLNSDYIGNDINFNILKVFD